MNKSWQEKQVEKEKTGVIIGGIVILIPEKLLIILAYLFFNSPDFILYIKGLIKNL